VSIETDISLGIDFRLPIILEPEPPNMNYTDG
jgi:hypothetical protein